MKQIIAVAFVALFSTNAFAAADAQIRFSRHASERLMERHIQRVWIEHVVHMPDWTEPDPKHQPDVHVAFGAIAEAQGMILHVVYADVRDGELVITEYFDRAAAKRRPH